MERLALLIRVIETLSDVRVRIWNKDGRPQFEVTVGDFLRDFEIEERWQRIQAELENYRRDTGVVINTEVRTADGKFLRYSGGTNDDAKIRL